MSEGNKENKNDFWDSNPKTAIAMLLFPILFIVCLFGNIRQTFDYFKYLNWPSTQGEILEVKLRERQYTAKNKLHYQYIPQVHYQYFVNGNVFYGNIVSPFDSGRGTKEYATDFIKNYKPNDKVPVFYSISNPRNSFLEKRMNDRTKGNYLLTLLCFVISFVLWRYWKTLLYI